MKATLERMPEVAQAFTRGEILAAPPEGYSLLAQVRRSYYAPRDRDVVFVPKPYFINKVPTGTTHGTPYDYDQHVPQLWFGAGVTPTASASVYTASTWSPTLTTLK